MKAQQGFAEVNEGKIYYETSGDGFPIVLLHGFGLDLRMWKSQVEVLSEDYTVVCYDMRGYGKSTLPGPSPYSHLEDLKALLKFLGISQCYLLGFSIGGRVAIDFVIAYGEYVRALIVANTIPTGFQRREGAVTSSSELKLKARVEGVQNAREHLLDHHIFSYARRIEEVDGALHQMISDYSGWHWLNEDLGCSIVPPATQQVSKICVPTLIITSEYDGLDPRRAADFLHEHISGAQKVTLSKVGHMSNLEAPGQFNEVVLQFLLHLSANKSRSL